MGLNTDQSAEEIAVQNYSQKKLNPNAPTSNAIPAYALDFDKFDYKKQVMTFQGNCYACHAPCETKVLI
jgi:hypothetical protein